MPARNAAKTVGLAARSTLAAMPKDAELVIFDDGSTDDTADIVQQISDPRLRLFRSGISVGSGTARSSLLRQSDSRYVASIDADDVSLPWRFALQMRQIASGVSDLSFSSVIRFGQRRLPRPTDPSPQTPPETALILLATNPLFHSTMIASRSALEDVGGYGSAAVAQDYELWLRAASRGKRIVKTSLPVAAYRASNTQISASADYLERVRSSEPVNSSYRSLWELVFECPLPESPLAEELILSRASAVLRPRLQRRLERHIREYGIFPYPRNP